MPNFLVFFNKRWKFRKVSKLKDAVGKCSPPDAVGKEIVVLSSLKDQDELDTLLHEFLHACFWHLDESYVEQAGTDIARALWRIGYRKVTE